MSRPYLPPSHLAIAILAISVSYAEAADRKVETATLGTYANSKSLPVCTASSSLSEVLGDKCFLVKGSMIYGDIAGLSQLSIWAGSGGW
ncbi:MAG: hypothetical protein EOQ92_30555 [Mesorhizobium sp.]|nr:MAG: hypothetical protein EOQ92_30555 [Mesorhizobium sp.]RWK46572.1 MAG: hypothetical protein EOR47_25400 [Mesorhizobium sp.]RWK87654.1 MAG: hypothetical protein EOR53_34870 [Mesorhizobium sp.]TIQ25740.1 MAG: hypothetical protein E5X54_28870 [Mesorhizobium sp.]